MFKPSEVLSKYCVKVKDTQEAGIFYNLIKELEPTFQLQNTLQPGYYFIHNDILHWLPIGLHPAIEDITINEFAAMLLPDVTKSKSKQHDKDVIVNAVCNAIKDVFPNSKDRQDVLNQIIGKMGYTLSIVSNK